MNTNELSELKDHLRGRAARIRANRQRIGSPLQFIPEFDNCGYDPGEAAGLGDARSDLNAMPLPGALARYLTTGAPMPSYKRDLGAMTAQVPRWAYGVLAGVSFFFAGKAYRRWRDAK